ncbi:MAG: AMP-binding protein [Pyrinomonadaceae bacterium]
MDEVTVFEHQAIAWEPTAEVIAKSQLSRFMQQVEVSTWNELYEFSISDVEAFTNQVLKFLDVKFDPPFTQLLDKSKGIEWSKWCIDGGLNITEVCLDRWLESEIAENPALIWEDESGKTETFTYNELHTQTELVARGLRSAGFEKGDAIVIHLPMIPETVFSLLAINRIGAIAVPVFSGYGIEAIASRMNSVQAKGLITCEGFTRRGKFVEAFKVAEAAVRECGSLQKIFVASSNEDFAIESVTDDDRYVEFKSLYQAPEDSTTLEKTNANDPAIILYSSGTTGKPKGIAHVHCGFPLKAAQDMAFGTDVGKGTRISWLTDIGWMMGPWLIYGALINGATICIYDGSPDFPNNDRMWEFCAKHKIEIFGVSPTLIRVLSTKGDDLPKKHNLSSLRAFASTGEPWNPAPWWWLFEKVGNSKLPIINYSGGTEISGGILMGNLLMPQKPCSFPAPCLGMNVALLGETGEEVSRGEVGELAIRDTWIGMARGFWNEPERYLNTYWSRFEGIWIHGDWAMQDLDGHWYILGRSDDTLNVAGKRVGPAEIESVLVADSRVTEAAVIGVPDEIKGTAMVAFCVLAEDAPNGVTNEQLLEQSLRQNDELKAELKSLVAKSMGKPLTPKEINIVSAIPKTRNGKVMRRVVRAAYLGEDPGDVSSLENPDALKEIAASAVV